MGSDAVSAVLPILCALPFCLWVVWSDLAQLRIPNPACAGMALCFLLPVLTSETPLLAGGVVRGGAVLGAGALLFAAGLIGAGDAKFAASSAVYLEPGQIGLAFGILAAAIPAALLTHRLIRASPLAALAPGWKSWTSEGFPFGLVLAPSLIFYLMLNLSGV